MEEEPTGRVGAPGTVVTLEVTSVQRRCRAGRRLIESMKMHHEAWHRAAGRVVGIDRRGGRHGDAGRPAVRARVGDVDPASSRRHPALMRRVRNGADGAGGGLDRADLAECIERHRIGLDEARPDAVAQRRERRHRTARENVADLVDEGSFDRVRPGRDRRPAPPARARRPHRQHARPTASSAGSAPSTASCSGRTRPRAIAMSYDYTVLAGTQGTAEPPQEGPPVRARRAAAAADRVLHRGRRRAGRATPTASASPASTPGVPAASPSCRGLVPLVGVNAGYCFAGNAAILGCCDVVIATEDSNIGMGGPAMIEGGGLGVYEPTAVGPIEVQRANGVVDIVGRRRGRGRARRQAVPVVLPGPDRGVGVRRPGRCSATSIPADRLRSYDVRTVDRSALRHRARCSSCAATSASG